MNHIRHKCVVPAIFIFLSFGCFGQLRAEKLTFQFDVAQTQVIYTLGDILHTVQGTFRMKSGWISFDPRTGAAEGLVVVDATSGNSGNEGRDQRMHKDVLQSQLYQESTFVPTHVQGQIERQHESQLTVEGVLTLHGTQHTVTVNAHLNGQGDRLNAATRFDVPYVKWGLKNPSTFILRVSSAVNIDIHAVGKLQRLQTIPKNVVETAGVEKVLRGRKVRI